MIARAFVAAQEGSLYRSPDRTRRILGEVAMANKPILLGHGKLFPAAQSRMNDYPRTSEDVRKIRDGFLETRPGNLEFLLEKRYRWMARFIGDDEKGIEVGCGAGFGKLFIGKENFLATDVFENPWVDKVVDALDMPFPDSSLDFIVSSNMIHHLARPHVFFAECSRVLREGGKLIIQEINCSLMMRLILRIMSHEGYSYEPDVFDQDQVCNDPSDPWSANCAIPNLLFDDAARFESSFPFRIVHHRFSEFLVFPLSGGVNAKVKTIQLPRPVLRIIDRIDDLFIALGKRIFPLQRQVVLSNRRAPRGLPERHSS
jgi:SAM-dependent methyltransferase